MDLVLGEVLKADLGPVDSWPPPLALAGCGHGEVGHGVAFGACHELMPLAEQGEDEPAAGVVGIGHEQDPAVPDAGDREQQGDELAEQGPTIAVGEHQALVNARGQGHRGNMPGRSLDQQGDGLQ